MPDMFGAGLITLAGGTIHQVSIADLAHNADAVEFSPPAEMELADAAFEGRHVAGTFSTEAVVEALTALGFSCAAISVANPFVAVYRQMATGSDYAATSTHKSVTATSGIALPQRLTVPRYGPARLEVAFYLVSADGTTRPYTVSLVAAGSADSMVEQWGAGPIYYDNNIIDQVTEWSIDFGANVQLFNTGLPFHTGAYLAKRSGLVIRITTTDPTYDASTKIDTGQTVTNSLTTWLRAKTVGGLSFEVDASEVHTGIRWPQCILRVAQSNAGTVIEARPTKASGEDLATLVEDSAIAGDEGD